MNLSMLNQALKLKSKLEKAQKELGKTTLEVISAKGAVKITINGKQEIQSIKISPEVVDPNKTEHLERLVLEAVSEAIAKSRKMAAKQMEGLTGGIKIPGLT